MFPIWLINRHLKWETLLNRKWTNASESSIHYKWKTLPQEVSFEKQFLYTSLFWSYCFSLTLYETWHNWLSIPSEVLKYFYVWTFNNSTSPINSVLSCLQNCGYMLKHLQLSNWNIGWFDPFSSKFKRAYLLKIRNCQHQFQTTDFVFWTAFSIKWSQSCETLMLMLFLKRCYRNWGSPHLHQAAQILGILSLLRTSLMSMKEDCYIQRIIPPILRQWWYTQTFLFTVFISIPVTCIGSLNN